jgi:hypothetical protein
MSENRVLTCVYCGKEYPQDTPAWDNDILTEHIKVCEKHPMRKAEETIKKLRSALVGLVGAGAREELEQMEFLLRIAEAPEQDKVAAINAIHVLLDTVE